MKIRELTTILNFDVDDDAIKAYEKEVEGVKKGMGRFAKVAAGVGVALAGSTAAMIGFLSKAGDMEQWEIAFDTMIGDVTRSRKLIEDLTDFAKKTPFELPGVIEQSKRLLAYGFQAESIIDTINTLGNISAGVGREKLPFLTLALGQVFTAGKLRGQEIRQFTEAGVPLIQALSDHLGIAQSQIAEMTSRGEISFDQVNGALRALVQEGGRFNNLMIRQSKSLKGLWSNTLDALGILAIGIGKELLPEAKAAVSQFMEWLEVNEDFIKQGLVKYFKEIMKALKQLAAFMMSVFSVTMRLTGGLGNLVKITKALFILFAMYTTGALVVGIYKVAKAFRAMAVAAGLANASAAALPLLIGAGIAAIFLLVDDLFAYLDDRPSLIGFLIDKIGPVMNKLFAEIEKIQSSVREFFKNMFGNIFDMIDPGSWAWPLKLGYILGEAIVIGMANKFKEAFPRLGGFLLSSNFGTGSLPEHFKLKDPNSINSPITGSAMGAIASNFGRSANNTVSNTSTISPTINVNVTGAGSATDARATGKAVGEEAARVFTETVRKAGENFKPQVQY